MAIASLTNYCSGISGLQLPIAKRDFPEELQSYSRLRYYSTLFNSIEFNSTFYKLPRQATVGKWATDVEGDFKFTFKVWQQITHNKHLQFDQKDVESFFSVVAAAGEKKGYLLVQFPASIRINDYAALIELLAVMKECNADFGWRIAIEFRHPSWYNHDVYDLLQDFNMSLVVHDKSRSVTPFFDFPFDFIYVRFHGPEGDYRGSYSQDFLHEYADYVKEWLAAGKHVCVYFNNTMGDAIGNLKTLNQFVIGNK